MIDDRRVQAPPGFRGEIVCHGTLSDAHVTRCVMRVQGPYRERDR
jgi:hypothetical protein